jgi:hypothetical protein
MAQCLTCAEYPGGPSRRTCGGQRRLGWPPLSRPTAAEGGGRRPAFTAAASPAILAPRVDGSDARGPVLERGPRRGCCKKQRQHENAGRAARNALMPSAGYFCAPVAAFRFLSAADAITVRFTASGAALRKHGVSGVGRPGGATRQLTVVGPCTQTETAGIALDGDA